MNVIRFELFLRKFSFLIWFSSFTAVFLLFLTLYPTFAESTEIYQNMIKQYPKEVIQAIGISLSTMTSFIGFYTYMLTFLNLVVCTFVFSTGIQTFIFEKENGLNEILFVKPISRMKLWVYKFVSLLIISFGFIFLFTMSMLLVIRFMNVDMNYALFIQIQFGLILTVFLILSISMFISTLLKRVRYPTIFSLMSVMSLFLIKFVVSYADVSYARYISPLSYFDPASIVKSNGLEWQYMIVGLTLSVFLFFFSYYRYVKMEV